MSMAQSNFSEPKVYDDGLTKQEFKDSADINKILMRAQKQGTISHLAKYEPVYGDFADMPDLLTAHTRMERGMQIFSELPSEVRREFDQDAGAFFKYVNDPANKDKLAELLPGLAKPGRQRIDVGGQLARIEALASVAAGNAGETNAGDSPSESSTEPGTGSQGAGEAPT